MLLNRYMIDENHDEALLALWKLKIPSKASHFAWRLIRDKMPTKVQLRRRNVEMIDVCCPFCRSCNEDVPHLFFTCVKTMSLWWESLSWLNTAGVFLELSRENFLQHSYCNLNGIRL